MAENESVGASLTAPPAAAPAAPAPPAASPTPTPTAPTSPVPEWMTGSEWVPQDLRGDKTLARYKTPGDALKALTEQHKVISNGLTKIPGKDAKPEEVAEFRTKLGVPKDVSGYAEVKLQPIEGLGPIDSAMVDSMAKPAFLEIGLTPQQAQNVLNLYGEYTARQRRNLADAFLKGQEELEGQWGMNFDPNVALAQRALRKYAPEGLLKLLADSQLDMHPDMIRMFHSIGRQIAEDGLIEGNVPGAATPDQLKETIARIRAELAAERGNDSPRARQLQEQLNQHYRTLYPER